MENNFNNFAEYRAELRYKHFNNNKYNNMSDFQRKTRAYSFWDVNFFNHIYKIPCSSYDMRELTFQKFLDSEIDQPTIDWGNMFDYISALEKHPYFKDYHATSGTNGDNQFWSILNNYKTKLTDQISNNQQIWF